MAKSSELPVLVRFLALALLVGGAGGAIGSFLLLRGIWVWNMPDLALRFLAAAAVSYCVAGLLTLVRPRWPEAMLLMASVAIYAVPLVLAVLLRSDPIDWSRWEARAFVVVVTPALLIAVYYLARERARFARGANELPPAFQVGVVVLGVALLALGTAIFVAPRDLGALWPWGALRAWKIIDSRLLASMLLTIGAEALLVAWWRARAQAELFLAMLSAYGIVAAVGLAIHASKSPAQRGADIGYIVAIVVVLAASFLLYGLQTRRVPRLAT